MKERNETELGAIWARVLIVSSGCPTKTCAAPPKLPAMSSLTVSRVFCGMMRPGGGSVSKGEPTHVSTSRFGLTRLCLLTLTLRQLSITAVMDLEGRLRRADDAEFLLQTDR